MTRATPENDQRRKKLLSQLAAILQVDVGLEGDAAHAPAADVATSSNVPSEAPHRPNADNAPAKQAASPADRQTESIIRQHATLVTPATPKAERRANEFIPIAPSDFSELRLGEIEVESLVLKYLFRCQNAAGREIAQFIGIAFGICEKFLYALKTDRFVVIKASASLGDYVYELTEAGIHRARNFAEHCSYFGTAPVCLDDYEASVTAQSLRNSQPQIEDLRRAFADLTLSEETFERLGRAIISGKGLFLHGPPGNGKSSIAQRVTKAFREAIWIPRAISAWGEIIRVFDPSCHEELPPENGHNGLDGDINDAEKIDCRWVRIRRPTIIAGGELVLDHLEITPNPATGIAESPLQLKSNCGTLVIDDFGRQQVAPAALLNRWIVPLEKRYDYLSLPSGRKIRVPFDQLIVFSTNLEPRELVDEAFLRRIPYKVDICGPTEEQFRTLLLQIAVEMGIEPFRPAIDHLIDHYYRKMGREMRFCQPRDLLRQVKVFYDFIEEPARLSVEAIDAAATDYFSVL